MNLVRTSTRLLWGGVAVVCGLWGQQRLDSRLVGDRILLVVPMVGAGTAEDPVRPLLAPIADGAGKAEGAVVGVSAKLPAEVKILSWRYEASDDGKTALLELVAKDRSALAAIKALNRSDVKIFELGKATKGEIEAEFRKVKLNFDADSFASGGVKIAVPVAGGKN